MQIRRVTKLFAVSATAAVLQFAGGMARAASAMPTDTDEARALVAASPSYGLAGPATAPRGIHGIPSDTDEARALAGTVLVPAPTGGATLAISVPTSTDEARAAAALLDHESGSSRRGRNTPGGL